MNCPNCQAEVVPGTSFCDNCGSSLQNVTAAAPPVVQAGVPEVVVPPPAPPVEEHAPLPPPLAPPQTSGAMPGSGPRLVVAGSGTVIALPVGKELLLGRTDPEDGIYPDIDFTPYDTDQGVSRSHAKIHERGGQWFVRDLKSTNYTLVNRRKLDELQDYLLEDGDEVRFGRLTVTFRTS